MKTLVILAAVALSGCASTTVYQPTVVGDKVASAKVFSIQGDISGAFTLQTQPGGGVLLDVKPLDSSQVLMQRIAVTDGKGNPMFGKDGQPVYNEIPLVAGLNHSRPTGVAWDGLSKGFRSVGSVIGTIAAAMTGASVANSVAEAIPAQ
jgi:hypothetical protein